MYFICTRFKKLISHLSIFCLIFTLSACKQNDHAKKIGIIIPLEHQAMNEISAGFKETVGKTHHDVKIKVANSQGDINLLRAIIQQMKDEHYDLIAPVGTDATQMTLAMIHDQPVVSLASSMTDKERHQLKKCNVAIVHDEITNDQYIKFIHTTYPHIKQITLIHSPSEKIYPEIEELVNKAKQFDIKITPMMAQSLNDLSIITNNIPKNSQAILILKDSLIVSGITTLEKVAERRQIPLISSDQGSVQNGAAIALGVYEREIGVHGGQLAAEILSSKSACDLPIVNMNTPTVFINKNTLEKSGLSVDTIKNAAQVLHLPIELS